MRPKTGLPKRRALRRMPEYSYGLKDAPNRPSKKISKKSKIDVLSMFAGCGGMDLGFLGGFEYLGKKYDSLPFNILKAIDLDEKSVETYNLNIGDHAEVGDLTEIAAHELPKARVLIGGFPCQDFSSSGPKLGFSGDRGQLYKCLANYMREHKPDLVVGENVPHLATLHGGQYLAGIIKDFESEGYNFTVWNLYGPDYGLSQSRRRLFLVGVRADLGYPPPPPKPTHIDAHIPIEDALDDLIKIDDESVTNQSQYFVATRATAGGGQGDHTNQRGKVAYCIRANAKARIQFHYELDRRLTVRECARLQSFPDEFVFPFAAMNNMSQIGNAVPPILAHVVAEAVLDHLNQIDRGNPITEPRPMDYHPSRRKVQPTLFNWDGEDLGNAAG